MKDLRESILSLFESDIEDLTPESAAQVFRLVKDVQGRVDKVSDSLTSVSKYLSNLVSDLNGSKVSLSELDDLASDLDSADSDILEGRSAVDGTMKSIDSLLDKLEREYGPFDEGIE